jgi:hypothetical protein
VPVHGTTVPGLRDRLHEGTTYTHRPDVLLTTGGVQLPQQKPHVTFFSRRSRIPRSSARRTVLPGVCTAQKWAHSPEWPNASIPNIRYPLARMSATMKAPLLCMAFLMPMVRDQTLEHADVLQVDHPRGCGESLMTWEKQPPRATASSSFSSGNWGTRLHTPLHHGEIRTVCKNSCPTYTLQVQPTRRKLAICPTMALLDQPIVLREF